MFIVKQKNGEAGVVEVVFMWIKVGGVWRSLGYV